MDLALYRHSIGGVVETRGQPLSFYYNHDRFQTRTYAFINELTWDAFLGSALSASYVPSEDHPRYPRFEQALRYVFDRFSTDGCITTHGVTELHIGQMLISP